MTPAVRCAGRIAIPALALCAATTCLAQADGAKLFGDKGCVSCHGEKGQGIPGLAPPLKASPFVTSAAASEIKETIVKGRVGQNRRHPNIPGGMPGVPMPDEEAEALVKYLKGDLQK